MPRLYRCLTKATTAEGDDIRRSINWVIARRGILKIYDDHLELGAWYLAYNGYVLKIKSQGTIYQFGLNYNRFWEKDLPFPVERGTMTLKLSRFSIPIRAISLVFLGYLLWQYLTS